MKTTKGTVIILIRIMILVVIFGHIRSLKVNSVEALELKEQRIVELSDKNKQLLDKLQFSQKNGADDRTKQIVKGYIDQYFENEATQATRIFECESGLNPKTSHLNSNGSVDLGVAQINSSNKSTFERVTGKSYEIWAHDIETNIKFAKWFKDHTKSGWDNWVCYQLEKKK